MESENVLKVEVSGTSAAVTTQLYLDQSLKNVLFKVSSGASLAELLHCRPSHGPETP